jgi:hypothetical protein
MIDCKKTIEDLQEGIRMRDKYIEKYYGISPQDYEFDGILTAYDIFNSTGVTKNLEVKVSKIQRGRCDPSTLKARYQVALKIAHNPTLQNSNDRELSGHLTLVLEKAREVLADVRSEAAYVKWLSDKTSEKDKPRNEKDEDEFGDWKKPDKDERRWRDGNQRKTKWQWLVISEFKSFLKPAQERLAKLDRSQRINLSILTILSVIATALFINWCLAPPPPVVIKIDPEIEQEINAKMEELFKRCVDEEGKEKRYTRYDGKLYEIGNLSWLIIPEPISAEDREFNNIRFRGKIRLVRNPKRAELSAVYRVFDSKTKKYSEKHSPLLLGGDKCSPLPCVISVTDDNGKLKISPDYQELMTRCDRAQTPAKPLEDDYLTVDELADHRKKEIDEIIKVLESDFRGDCKKSFYVSNYERSAEEEGGTKKTCFVEATNLVWKLDQEEDTKTVKLRGTATELTAYCKTDQSTAYEKSEITDSISDSVTVKFQDRHWQKPEDISWTVFPCADAQRIIGQITKAKQEEERKEVADAERQRIENEKKAFNAEALSALVTECDGYLYTISNKGTTRHLYKIAGNSQGVKISYRDITDGVQITIEVQQESLCNEVIISESLYFPPVGCGYTSRFLLTANLKKMNNNLWEVRDAKDSAVYFQRPGCSEANRIMIRSQPR